MERGIKFLRPRDFNFGEEILDSYLEVKNIRKDDIFYECSRLCNHKLVALTNARRISDGFYVVVETLSGEKAEIFYSDFTSYPGPSLFLEPQYLTKVNKKLVYVIE